MTKLKLISINIEGKKHLDVVSDFLISEKPDVVCVQEIFEVDLPYLQERIGLKGSFVPIVNVASKNPYEIEPAGIWGMGFFSNLQFSSVKQYHYRGDFYHVPEFAHPNSANRLLMYTVVDKDGTNFPIFNTHFTWSVGGQVSDEQRQNFVKMELILDEFEEVILCGDFNTPRGKELYSKLAARYQDALPPEVKTTIDPVMHRGGALQLVVDGIFCSSHFEILSARTKYGVSDHQAIIVELQRKQA